MKLRNLLPIAILALTSLVACGKKDTYTVKVSNKDAITAEWTTIDSARTLIVEATKNGEAVNATQLLNTEIFVTSSDEEVVSALGFVLTPVAVGSATVTVTYHDAKETLELTVTEGTAKQKYGTTHAGTLDDPLTNADALIVGEYVRTHSDVTATEDELYIKGKIKSWYHFPGERSDGAVSWFLEPATAEEKSFEIYLCTKANGDALTDEDVWPGAEVVAYGPITYYSSGKQAETSTSKFVAVTGGDARIAPTETETTVNARNTGALAIGKKLADGDTTWDKYIVSGYVVNYLGDNKDGTHNYMIADSKTEASSANMFEIYGYSEELKFQAKVKVWTRIKNYHGTIETNVMTKLEVDATEQGGDWPNYPEPTLKEGTVAEFFADDSGNYMQAYRVSGVVTRWKDDTATDGTKYGNFYIKDEDGETDYYIYGATATASALAWSKYANKYSFTNPQDFLENSITKEIKVGSYVTMKLVRCDYTDRNTGEVTPEGTGIVEEVGVPQPKHEVAIAASSFTADPSDAKIATFTSGAVTLTLDKNESSTNNRLSDSDHLRVYAGAKLTAAITGGTITKIQYTCTAASYAVLANIEVPDGYTVEVSGTIVIITVPANATPTSVAFVARNAQVRVNNAKIYYNAVA